MALTPDDVVHKRFETTRFRDGYDQDEVDDFLDEVVTELRRLTEENEALRAENEQLKQGGAVAAPVADAQAAQPVEAAQTVDTAELDELRAENERLQQQLAEAESRQLEAVVVAEPQQASEQAPVQAPAEAAPAASGEANGLIALATRLHDEHVAAGEARRDELIAAAQVTAQQIEDDAEQRKTALEQEYDDQKARLEQQKVSLEQKIDELKSFERDYRLKLRGYIESQLRDLDRSSSLAFGGQGGN
jgi:DivIVA domain-containing protein